MRSLSWLVLMFSACRCGAPSEQVIAVPLVAEAGVIVRLPEVVKPIIPRLDRLVKDEASVERNMIELKGLGLGYLVDAGETP
jgi:hypothetical protein